LQDTDGITRDNTEGSAGLRQTGLERVRQSGIRTGRADTASLWKTTENDD